MQLVLVAASSVCAILPMLMFLGIVWWLDRYDREPVWLLVTSFSWGAVGAITSAVVVSLVVMAVLTAIVEGIDASLAADLSWIPEALGPVVVAPFVEEPAKAVILLLVLWNRHFDNMTDGFVYGAAAGLGFGMTENFLYFVSGVDDIAGWTGTVLVRTFYSAVMHGTATAIVGASLGYARFRGPLKLGASGAIGLGLAMGVHSLWNGLLTAAGMMDAGGILVGTNLLLFPLEVLFTFVVFELCVQEEAATIRRELKEEVAAGRMPKEHPAIIASWFRRLRVGWLPSHVDRERYVRVATELAMRKKQARQMGARAPRFYRDEVGRLQRQLEVALRG